MSKTFKEQSQNLEIAKKQFDEFDQSIKELSEVKNERVESEPTHNLSQNQIANSKDIYLKPLKTVSDRVPFNEKYRADYEFQKELVCFIAEHKEIIGERIEVWTKKFPGISAEYWEVPSGKPVWGPRYLAESIARCSYHRLKSEDRVIENSGLGQITGGLVVDHKVQRLDAVPANKTRKSIFMGA